MGKRKVPEEQLETLRAGLRETAAACRWDAGEAGRLVDVALRRWFSFERRSKPTKRSSELHVRDLRRGLEEQYEEPMYLEPGWTEHLADDFADYLLVTTVGASDRVTSCRLSA
jgi:hypothetical protein